MHYIVTNTRKDICVEDDVEFDCILAQAELLKPETLPELLGAVGTPTEDNCTSRGFGTLRGERQQIAE